MATIVKATNSTHPCPNRAFQGLPTFYRIYVKDASEIVLGFCDKAVRLGTSAEELSSVVPMDDSLSREFNRVITSYPEQTLLLDLRIATCLRKSSTPPLFLLSS